MEERSARREMIADFRDMLEVNADIDRNRNDFEFAARPGRIHYIFDENTFEMFVEPRKRAFDAPALFTRADNSKEGSDLRAQSAMISSEWLMSGNLPGQGDGQILMTEWHLFELTGLRQRVLNDHRRFPKSDNEVTSFFAKLDALQKAAGEPDPAEVYGELRRSLEPALRREFDEYQARGWSRSVLARSLLVHECARVLATDPVSEPLQQADRLFSPEIGTRLRALHNLFPFPADHEALATLRSESERWRNLLLREEAWRKQAAEENSKAPGEPRDARALKNDAQSLAYIRWVVNAKSDQRTRFVFVTGDELVFDTYRRWYFNEKCTEPFFMRRPQQFAPVLNPQAMPSDLSSASELFDRIREGLELPLIIFNLKPEQENESDGNIHTLAAGRREDTILKLSRPEMALEDPSITHLLRPYGASWWERQHKPLQELWTNFLAVQRLAIGAHFELVSRRLNHVQKMQAAFVAQPGEGGAAGFVASYARQLGDSIVQNSTQLFFLPALEFVQWQLQQHSGSSGAIRAPIALRLRLSQHGGVEIDVQQLIESFGEELRLLDINQNPELAVSRQHVIFAVAACFALKMGEWSAAERWSDFALGAAELRARAAAVEETGIDATALEVDLQECRYLRALCSRFWLGSIAPHGSRSTDNHWLRFLRIGETCLDGAEQYHSSWTPRQILRELRAVSERAAARLFYATWFVATADEPLPKFMTAASGYQALLDGWRDLERCLELELEVEESCDPLDDKRDAFFRRIRRQYNVNLAAAELLFLLYGRLHKEATPTRAAGLRDQITGRVRTVLAEGLDVLPQPVRVDLFGYLSLVCGDDTAGFRLHDALIERTAGSLRMDRGMAAAVHQAAVLSRCS